MSRAFIAADRGPGAGGGFQAHNGSELEGWLAMAPNWLLHDLGRAFAALASPTFIVALAAGLGAFYLLILRRQRGA